MNNEYIRSEHDPCFFYIFGNDGAFTLAAVTLDDFLVAASDKNEMYKFNTML